MFVIEIPCCDLDLLYYSTQAYRWIKVNDNKYIVINGDKIVLVQQRKDKKAFICPEEKFYEDWYDYFDIGYDYFESLIKAKKFAKVSSQNCPLSKYLIKQYRKLRILKNDLLETMIFYALDEGIDFYNTILYKQRRKDKREDKIKDICEMFGKKRHNTLDGISIKWNEFPSIEDFTNDIARITTLTQNEVKRIKLIIYRLREQNDILSQIRASDDYDETYELLQSIYDDPIWIKNVMLYALEFKQAFPIRESNKKTFHDLQLSPKMFAQFDDVKGLLLEYYKMSENKSTLSKWSK